MTPTQHASVLDRTISKLPVYGHILGYLHRWRLAGLGRLSIRLHRIFTPDGTPFVHTHPFHYVSIVLRGGYTEQYVDKAGSLLTVRHRAGKIIVRSNKVAHRITVVDEGCLTLFFAWSMNVDDQGWRLQRHPEVRCPDGYQDWPDGIYAVAGGFRRRLKGVWYALRASEQEAAACERLSIRQDIKEAKRVA